MQIYERVIFMKVTCIPGGDMPDPTILRVGDYFYLTCSTLNYSPGLIIRRSANLVEWETVCSVFEECLGDVWAPELVRHNGKFYIYFPTNKNGHIQVFATCSDRIDGDWRTPVPVGAEYLIDPGFISDGENCWLYFNDGYCARLTEDCMRLAEKPYKVWQPWQYPEDWKTEGMCAESPKLFRKNGFYYLIAAEGGTAGPPTSHMAVCFRSASPLGPWEPSPYNPIIHTYSSDEEWWSTGHATYFEDAAGKGYFVYHGYKNSNRNMGRQILVCRAEWTKDGFPAAADSDLAGTPEPDFTDNFSENTLGLDWSFYKGTDNNRFTLSNGLILKACGSCASESRPMTVNTKFENSVTECRIGAVSDGAAAGLLLFYSEKASLGIYLRNKKIFAEYLGEEYSICDIYTDEVYLRITKKNNRAVMAYSADGKDYTEYPCSFDVSEIEHNRYKGYLSLRSGITCFGKGESVFKAFSYRRLE